MQSKAITVRQQKPVTVALWKPANIDKHQGLNGVREQKTRILARRDAGFCTSQDFLKRGIGGIGGVVSCLETVINKGVIA